MLKIGGVTPFTSIEFPGRLAAVLFCQGCPWRCGYCHNPHLLPDEANGVNDWRDAIHFLKKRHGLLDAVVFSGGEPTIQQGLPDAIREVKEIGLKVGLQTSGAYPECLRETLPLVDLVTMDIKAPFEEYDGITGVAGSGEIARKSAELVLQSGVRKRFRTTLDPFLHEGGRLDSLAEMIRSDWKSEWEVQEPRVPAHLSRNGSSRRFSAKFTAWTG
jgi:pyruvate formate lyase activating enzyme